MTTYSIGLTREQLQQMSVVELQSHLESLRERVRRASKAEAETAKTLALARLFGWTASLCDYCPDNTEDDGYVCPVCGGTY